jgi:cytochrome bd-type quinol oxidase subunit 1
LNPVVYRDFFGLDPRLAVWVVAQLHLMFGAFVLGVPIFAVIIELVGMRTGDRRFDRLAHEFTRLLSAAFATTAALGGTLAFLLMGLYPHVMRVLGSSLHSTFYIYGGLFFGEAFTLYLYYYGWHRMDSRRGRAHELRKVLWGVAAVLGLAMCVFIFSGGAEEAHLRKHGEQVASRARPLGQDLLPYLEGVVEAGATGERTDEEGLSAAVDSAAESVLEAGEVDDGAPRADAARLVGTLAATMLREEDSDRLVEAFPGRLAEEAENTRLDFANRASELSLHRWRNVAWLGLGLALVLGVASYLASLKALHLYLGLLLNLFGTALMLVANAWATYMMAPTGVNEVTLEFGGTTWGAVNNPLWNPLNIHRLLANVVFGGFVAAAYAAVKFLGSTTDAERAHYDWMGYVGNFVGMVAMVPLPFAGYYLGREIYSYSPLMGNNMMGGAFSWSFIMQALLIGMLFIGANYYLWVGMQRIEGAERYLKFIPVNTVILFVCFAIWLIPHNLPLTGAERGLLGGVPYHPVLKYFGLMPAKNAAVNLIILSTFFSFLMYRRANKGTVLPFRTHGLAGKLIVAGAGALSIALLAWYIGVIQGLDPAELSVPAANRWVFDWAAWALLFEAAMVLVVVVLTFRDRGILGQFLYFGCTAVLAAGFFGVWGFVTMVEANPFLRNIAVCQVLMVLSCLILNTAIDIVLFRRAPEVGRIHWGMIPARAQYALVLTCVSVVLLMGLMGFIRSGLREDWHIYGVLRDTSASAFTPSLATMAWVVAFIALVFFGLVAFVFWLSGLGEGKAEAEPKLAEGEAA